MIRRISAYIFLASATGMAISLAGFVCGVRQSGVIFITCFFVLLIGALIAAVRREGGARNEDIITLAIGSALAAWVLYRNL